VYNSNRHGLTEYSRTTGSRLESAENEKERPDEKSPKGKYYETHTAVV
jgi:hypothetical protein